MEKRDSITFLTDDNEEVEFYVLEQTMLSGVNYILVVDTLDDEDEDAEVLILKEQGTDADNNEFATYEIVDNDAELEYISKIFEELLEDVDIEL